MDFSNLETPSNRAFGLFSTLLCLILAVCCYRNGLIAAACSFLVASGGLALVTALQADLLQPLNKLWMRFGLLLGTLITPILLSVIFFGLFTPAALLMRLFGRDELRLKFKKAATYWIPCDEIARGGSLKDQF